MAVSETPIYNLEELSGRLKISIKTLRGYIKKGELKAKKVGKAYYVTEPNLLAFFEPNHKNNSKELNGKDCRRFR